MSDRLTAEQLSQLTGPTITARPRHTLTIDSTDYSDRIIKMGRVKWQLFNRHPKKPGTFNVPVQTLVVDNRDGLFTVGNADGPWPTEEDRRTSKVQTTTTICSPAITINDFTGAVRPLTHASDGTLTLEIEHPLKLAHERVWKREDKTSDFQTSTTVDRTAAP